MLARNIAAGGLTGDTEGWVVSIQEQVEDGTITGTWLSFHSGDQTIARVHTDAEFELEGFDRSRIDYTEYGYKIQARTAPRPGFRMGEAVFFDGPVERIELEQDPRGEAEESVIPAADQPINLYVNDRYHSQGERLTWTRKQGRNLPAVSTTDWNGIEATFRTAGLVAPSEKSRLVAVGAGSVLVGGLAGFYLG